MLETPSPSTARCLYHKKYVSFLACSVTQGFQELAAAAEE